VVKSFWFWSFRCANKL